MIELYREIKIGETVVPMRANAATPYRYRQIFGADLFAWFDALEVQETPDDRETAEGLLRLGYVMHLQARAPENPEIYDQAEARGEEGYILWKEELDLWPAMGAWPEILALYTGQSRSQSVKKKKTGPSTGT